MLKGYLVLWSTVTILQWPPMVSTRVSAKNNNGWKSLLATTELQLERIQGIEHVDLILCIYTLLTYMFDHE